MKSFEEVVEWLARKQFNNYMNGGDGRAPSTKLISFIYKKNEKDCDKMVRNHFKRMLYKQNES